MITVVQLRVLRKMVNVNVMTLTHGGAFFRGEEVGNVRKQTIRALEKKGLVEDVSDLAWRWRGCEYSLTDAGREVVEGPLSGGLVGFASSAIRRVFDDTSVSDEQTLGSLELLRDEIDSLIDVVRESIEVRGGGLLICLGEEKC